MTPATRALAGLSLAGGLLLLLLVPVGGQQYFPPLSQLPNLSTLIFGGGTATATVQGTLTTSTTQLCTTAVTTEEILWTYSLPANTLDANGRGVRVTAWLALAATATVKTSRVWVGATAVSTHSGTVNNGTLLFDAVILRDGASSQAAVGAWSLSTTGVRTPERATPAGDTTGAIVIKVTGQNGTANANDICFRGAVVETLK